MTNSLKKLFSAVMVFCIVIGACVISAGVSEAASTIGSVNLANADKHQSGPGYSWDNINHILTLDGLNIVTDEDFGLKVPAGATVVLKGKNSIKAAKYGIGCPGSVTFEGAGDLTSQGGQCGIYSYSNNENHKVLIAGGDIEFIGDTWGMKSDNAIISIAEGELDVVGKSGTAIDTRAISITGGESDFSGSVKAKHLISVDRADIDVESSSAALVSENMLKLENVRIKAGSDDDRLVKVDSYSGENCVELDAIGKGMRGSFIFGSDVPIIVDFLILAGTALLIGAVIAVPIIVKSKKKKKLFASLADEKNSK